MILKRLIAFFVPIDQASAKYLPTFSCYNVRITTYTMHLFFVHSNINSLLLFIKKHYIDMLCCAFLLVYLSPSIALAFSYRVLDTGLKN